MSSTASWGLALAAALAAFALPAAAATGDVEPLQVAEVASARVLGDSADLTLRFVQEDGPESGHVRVELTPETRPLTIIEARIAAERGFFAALNEPGVGKNLSLVTVVVRLMPRLHPDPDGAEQVVVYRHKSGPDWSVTAGE
jgi:hypothetical protein